MIQADTIRIGSGRTVPVVGAYWISSIRLFRDTTLPGLVARLRLTSNGCGPGDCPVPVLHATSPARFLAPRSRF